MNDRAEFVFGALVALAANDEERGLVTTIRAEWAGLTAPEPDDGWRGPGWSVTAARRRILDCRRSVGRVCGESRAAGPSPHGAAVARTPFWGALLEMADACGSGRDSSVRDVAARHAVAHLTSAGPSEIERVPGLAEGRPGSPVPA